MKITICDDDEKVRKLIREYVIHFFHERKYEEPEILLFSSAEAMLSRKEVYDIAFLDVELPGLSGIAAGDRLKKWNSNIILFVITGYSDVYLDEAFDVGVFRYLMKPIDESRLHRNLQTAIRKYNSVCRDLVVDTDKGLISVDSSIIKLVRAENRKTILYTVEGMYASHLKFKEWIDILPASAFMVINKGVVVSLQYVKREENGELQIKGLETIKDVYVSRKYLSEFRKRWLLFQEIK